MSHIDAKAETKGVEATQFDDNYSEAAAFAGITFSQACQFDMKMRHLLGKGPASGFLPPDEPELQRHARINCNGKSCGEVNCDTCHPQEGELPALEFSKEDWDTVVAGGTENGLYKLSVSMVCRERQLREALQKVKERDIALALACELHGCASKECTADQYRADGERIFADFAALKATPKGRADELLRMARIANSHFSRHFLGRELSVQEASDSVHTGALIDEWNAAQSFPSPPLEEPEQLVCDAELEEARLYNPVSRETSIKIATECQAHRRAMAARRGGK